jgi:hypothetical protein
MSARRYAPLLCLTVLLAFGCSRKDPLGVQEVVQLAPAPGVDATSPATGKLETSSHAVEGGIPAMIGGRKVVNLEAGSVDGLAAAIAAAGVNGVVLVKAGTHTESNTVRVEQSVRIVGEPGAILISTTSPLAAPTDPFDPAIHVVGAADVIVMGLTMRPSGAVGGVGILIEGAPNATIYKNTIEEYSYGVVTDHANDVKIWKNTIPSSFAWTTGGIPESIGIFCMSGDRADVANNDCSRGLANYFVSGADGKLTSNRAHDGYIGFMLCHPPHDSYILPSGAFVDPESPAKNWVTRNNDARDNANIGYLVIDGSHHNLLQANSASNNALYDIELTGESLRFGFLTPLSHDNTVKAAPFGNLKIKNCGENNVVIGGQLVDNTAEPCN